MERIQLDLPADRKYLSLIGAILKELCTCVPDMPAMACYNVQLAVDEAVDNIITHAYPDNPAGRMQFTFELRPDRLVIQVRDWGLGFDPSAVPEPDLARPRTRGYGVYLIRQMMDSVVYEPNTADGNLVTLVKMAHGGSGRAGQRSG